MRYRVCFLAAFHTVPAFACWMSSTECVDDAVALLQLRRQDDVVKELAAVIGKRQADHEEESLQEASSHVIENLKSLDLVSKLKARRMSYGAVLEKVISEALHAARKAMAPLDIRLPAVRLLFIVHPCHPLPLRHLRTARRSSKLCRGCRSRVPLLLRHGTLARFPTPQILRW
eukprot:gnl/TRDRNA2_/TRDRNA2_167846_c0_seq4.p1 gnl/TRDRNA2_/TRDRNA2_167846_c0~~gnl/TRDRNA2_/TRDRNA2_167846_c0_seq4.p1  ORF type:complete len:173 (+),score=8.71 gnl/TRDRNA2_/TRDRNA2_167846_c0_seq4:79-597(+)